MELAHIGIDVYACLQPDTGLGASNSGFVARDGGLVVDTMWDLPRTRNLIDLYATVSRAPARRLVNTHHNGDHCWGNQLFAETGAEIIGHRLCAEYFTREASPEMFVALCEAPDVAPPLDGFARSLRAFDFHDIVLTPPTTLIDDDTVIDLDGTPAHLLYVGPAHTPGDVVVHLPDDGIVFTGDILFHRCTPIGWEGTFANWIAALERIEALEPAIVVPGHGPLADVDGLRGQREYLEYVLVETRESFDLGRSTLEAAEHIDLGPYGLWTEPERLAFQVDRAYREFAGVAWDHPVDTTKVFTEVAALRERYACVGDT
jgi:glyoxylase-like metal-dependent hydrolase (beta-lactamase superfamily II)